MRAPGAHSAPASILQSHGLHLHRHEHDNAYPSARHAQPQRTGGNHISSGRAFTFPGFLPAALQGRWAFSFVGLSVHACSLFRTPKKDHANACESVIFLRTPSERT